MSDTDEPKATSTSLQTYEPGSIVWAKLKGYPWWPARVERVDDLPENVRSLKKSNAYPVYFFGSWNYGWFASDELKSYEEHKEELSNNSSKKLQKAIQYVEDPDLIERENREAEERKKQKKAATPSKRRSSIGEAPSSKKKPRTSSAGETPNGKNSKKPRASLGSSAKKTKKRAVADSDEDEKEEKPEKRRRKTTSKKDDVAEVEEAEQEDDSGNDTESAKKKKLRRSEDDSEKKSSKKLLRIRMKLQGFMKDLKETPELEDDKFEDALERLAELEDFPLTIELVKETKVGKLLKLMSKLDIPNDKYEIIPRALSLMQKLKTIVGEEHAAGESKANEPLENVENAENDMDRDSPQENNEMEVTKSPVKEETPKSPKSPKSPKTDRKGPDSPSIAKSPMLEEENMQDVDADLKEQPMEDIQKMDVDLPERAEGPEKADKDEKKESEMDKDNRQEADE